MKNSRAFCKFHYMHCTNLLTRCLFVEVYRTLCDTMYFGIKPIKRRCNDASLKRLNQTVCLRFCAYEVLIIIGKSITFCIHIMLEEKNENELLCSQWLSKWKIVCTFCCCSYLVNTFAFSGKYFYRLSLTVSLLKVTKEPNGPNSAFRHRKHRKHKKHSISIHSLFDFLFLSLQTIPDPRIMAVT